MPKITRHGGPTNAAAERETESVPVKEVGEQPSPGSSSSASSEKREKNANETTPPSPAPRTGNRSVKRRTGNSSARGTAGGPEGA